MPNAPIPSQRRVQRPLVLLILSLGLPLSFPAMRQPAPPAGGNRMAPAEAEPWRCCRSIRVEEMGEAIPGFVRAGRPRSRVYPSRRQDRRSHEVQHPDVEAEGEGTVQALGGLSGEV